MALLEAKPGSAVLTLYGKRRIAQAMYVKGKHFLGAALLLQRQGGYEAVVLHLLCQSVELVLKAALLFSDYDKYRRQLKPLGHNLEKLATVTTAAFGTHVPFAGLVGELKQLNGLYATHSLRYGTAYDLLVDPATIPYGRVLKKIVAVIRLIDRYMSRKQGAA